MTAALGNEPGLPLFVLRHRLCSHGLAISLLTGPSQSASNLTDLEGIRALLLSPYGRRKSGISVTSVGLEE